MFEALFGPDMPMAARFVLAFLVVLALIGGAAYLVRRFGVDRIRSAATRGRQPRLAVIDAAAVDSRRRLVLIRRDNIEHLLLIGGPTDVVVEPNIVRAAPAASARDVQAARAAGDAGRAGALVDSAMWPLQPEPTVRAPRQPHEEAESWAVAPAAEPPRGVANDSLAGLSMDLARSNMAGEPGGLSERPIPVERPIAERVAAERAASGERAHAAERAKAPEQPARAAQQPTAASELAAADQNLAEMAQRLEAALRRPMAAGGEGRPKVAVKITPASMPELKSRAEIRPDSRVSVFSPDFSAPAGNRNMPPPAEPARPGPGAADGKPPPAETKPTHAKAVYDSLEQEMASLLGRPTEKP